MENKIEDPDVKIYKPAKNAMQSGKSKKQWILEYIQKEKKILSPVTGWTGSSESEQQVKLKFNSKEEAVGYAERKNLLYILIEPNVSSVKIQSYTDALIS